MGPLLVCPLESGSAGLGDILQDPRSGDQYRTNNESCVGFSTSGKKGKSTPQLCVHSSQDEELATFHRVAGWFAPEMLLSRGPASVSCWQVGHWAATVVSLCACHSCSVGPRVSATLTMPSMHCCVSTVVVGCRDWLGHYVCWIAKHLFPGRCSLLCVNM